MLATSAKSKLWNMARKLSNAVFGPGLLHRSAVARSLHDAVAGLYRLVSPAHRRQARFHKQNPQAPWFVPEAIPALEALLTPDMRVFEWGSGNSTAWFARRVRSVVSVEGRAAWRDQVRDRLRREGLDDRAEVRLVEVRDDHDVPAAVVEAYAGAIREFPPRTLDVVLVDGHFRRPCLLAAVLHVRPQGLLVIDNADVPDIAREVATLDPYLIGHFSNGIWWTRIYRAPAEGFPALG